MFSDLGQHDVRLVLKDLALEHVKVASVAFKISIKKKNIKIDLVRSTPRKQENKKRIIIIEKRFKIVTTRITQSLLPFVFTIHRTPKKFHLLQ